MKALAFDEFGGIDKLRYRDVPDPKIGADDVLVRVRACALNHLDLFVRGRLRAIVDEVVPLQDGAAAQQRLEAGKQFGKIVLTP